MWSCRPCDAIPGGGHIFRLLVPENDRGNVTSVSCEYGVGSQFNKHVTVLKITSLFSSYCTIATDL